MNHEVNRLNSFASWPSAAAVDAERIAKAGFYYTGQGAEVQCFSCGGRISDWNYGDQLTARQHRFGCPFVRNPVRSGNVDLSGLQCPSNGPAIEMSQSLMESLQPIHDNAVTEQDDLYKSDALRLLSFINWNDDSVSREALVSAGFYHAGEGRLRCAWCGGELARIRRLGALGSPLEVHRTYFPGCTYAEALVARDAETRISPMQPPPAASPPVLQSPPTRGNGIESQPPTQTLSEGAVHNARVLLSAHAGGGLRSLGMVEVSEGARHPDKASVAARRATFALWPRDLTQTPDALAEAGFYYTGSADQVRCFYCDGGLGKWEQGDQPWREHARWFPHCGFVLLLKGQALSDVTAAPPPPPPDPVNPRRLSAENRVNFPITDSQIAEQMEGQAAMAALGAGLDVARVRRAITRRLRSTGLPFSSSEALIDAVLDEQLNEEAWSVPQSQRFARDILAETLREFAPSRLMPSGQWDERSDSQQSESISPSRSRSPVTPPVHTPLAPANTSPPTVHTSPPLPASDCQPSGEIPAHAPPAAESGPGTWEESRKPISLEEENRQLKEARLCKVCMDSEVSVVFLPCGHLVSCATCGATLAACPLCRAKVKAVVRAYLA